MSNPGDGTEPGPDGNSLQASGGNAASNCRGVASDLTKACWAGGAVQVYLNVAGRDPAAAGQQQVAARHVPKDSH